MNRLKLFLIIIFSFIFGFSTGVFVSFYKPSFYVKKVLVVNSTSKVPSFKQQMTILKEEFGDNKTKVEKVEVETGEISSRLKEIIPKFYKVIKEGINYHPALVFKVEGTPNGTEVHLLSFSLMEWDFIRTKLSKELILNKPDKVFVCKDGIIDIDYLIRGFWPPEVPKGSLEDRNLLVVPENNGKFTFKDFNGTCQDNGFVFNYSGELTGVCFGGNFIDSQTLYNLVPKSCKLIYSKEGENGNLQSKN